METHRSEGHQMDLGSAELDQLLSQTWARLESVETRRSADGAGDARGAGSAAGGKIRAVAAGGRLESLKLDPSALRLAPGELAGQIVTAVNAALDDLAAQACPAGQVPLPEPGVVAAQIAEIQRESMRQINALSLAIDTAVRRVEEHIGPA